jgi:hypothetical protein
MRRSLPLALLLVTACGDTTAPNSATGVLIPDTQTVAGVLEMRHSADAFERAPQWRLDTVPLVMFDGGEEVDLSSSTRIHLLSDGRGVIPVWAGDHGGDLWLFDASGKPSRVLARSGGGPGEMQGTTSIVTVPGDTIYLVDGMNGYINRYTADSGFLGGARGDRVPLGCLGPSGRLSTGQHVGVDGCGQARRLPDGTLNSMVALVTIATDFTSYDSIAAVAGNRMILRDMTVSGQTHRGVMSELALGQRTTVTAVDSTIVVGSGDGGYVLDLRNALGVTTQRIVVERPIVMVNAELRRRVIEQSVIQAMAIADLNLTEERAREMAEQRPFADTVGAYVSVTATDGGTIWVRDMPMPADSIWSLTAFRRDGAILGRLSGLRSKGRLTWLGDDRVIIQHEDEDGLVRFGVYRILMR